MEEILEAELLEAEGVSNTEMVTTDASNVEIVEAEAISEVFSDTESIEEIMLQKLIYHCSVCSYSARTPSIIRIHMNRHNPIDNFNCSLCSFSTHYKASLRKHIKRHTTNPHLGSTGKLFYEYKPLERKFIFKL